MLTQEILKGALALMGEPVTLVEDGEYEARTPYILAAFCTEVALSDQLYRKALGLETGEPYNGIYLALDAEFPVSERFCPAATSYLASMLLLEEDPDGSEKQFERYCEQLSALMAELPGMPEAIREVY